MEEAVYWEVDGKIKKLTRSEVEDTMKRLRKFLVYPEGETNQEELFERFGRILEFEMDTSPGFREEIEKMIASQGAQQKKS